MTQNTLSVTDRIQTIREAHDRTIQALQMGHFDKLMSEDNRHFAALDSLAADLEAVRAALAGAIDGAESYAEVAGVLIFDTEKARAALARLSAGKETT